MNNRWPFLIKIHRINCGAKDKIHKTKDDWTLKYHYVLARKAKIMN